MERAILLLSILKNFIGTDERIYMQIHNLIYFFLTTPSGIRQIKIELDFQAEKTKRWKYTTEQKKHIALQIFQ